MNMWNELLSIKRFREDQAELAVTHQRQACAEAEQHSQEAREQLESFRRWAWEHEREMYDALCSRLVRVREIEDVMQGVADLRQGEHSREVQLEQAQAQVQQEAERLVERREALREATRMVEKFIELAESHLAERLRELERKEDLEMEEAASVMRDRDDWHHPEAFEEEGV